MENWDNCDNRVEFELREVTKLEVLEYINNLGNSTTMGNDQIDSMTLKLNAGTLCGPIQHVINRSISTGTFCMKWKLAKTIPLHKGGN